MMRQPPTAAEILAAIESDDDGESVIRMLARLDGDDYEPTSVPIQWGFAVRVKRSGGRFRWMRSRRDLRYLEALDGAQEHARAGRSARLISPEGAERLVTLARAPSRRGDVGLGGGQMELGL